MLLDYFSYCLESRRSSLSQFSDQKEGKYTFGTSTVGEQEGQASEYSTRVSKVVK